MLVLFLKLDQVQKGGRFFVLLRIAETQNLLPAFSVIDWRSKDPWPWLKKHWVPIKWWRKWEAKRRCEGRAARQDPRRAIKRSQICWSTFAFMFNRKLATNKPCVLLLVSWLFQHFNIALLLENTREDQNLDEFSLTRLCSRELLVWVSNLNCSWGNYAAVFIIRINRCSHI